MQDRYFLKQGKLELSMLEENIEEIDDTKYILLEKSYSAEDSSSTEDSYVKEDSHNTPDDLQPKIKVSEEIFNTLKSMGQLLTHETYEVTPEEQEILLYGDESGLMEKLSEQDELWEGALEKQEEIPVIDELLSMSQDKIDTIIFSRFGETVPTFKYAEELKEKIDNRIRWIKSFAKDLNK